MQKMQFKREKFTVDRWEEWKIAIGIRTSSGSDAQDRVSGCQSDKLEKHPGKAGKNCHFHSADQTHKQCTDIASVGKVTSQGKTGLWFSRVSAAFCCTEQSLGGQSEGGQSNRVGWTPGMDGEQQLCSSLDKMLTVWNHIKGCDVEDSVCGLAQIQNILGGFVVFKDW